MDNNDVLRKVRYALDLKDSLMVKMFKSVDIEMSRNELSDYFVDEEDPFFKRLSNEYLLAFLDALIIEKRGKKDGK